MASSSTFHVFSAATGQQADRRGDCGKLCMMQTGWLEALSGSKQQAMVTWYSYRHASTSADRTQHASCRESWKASSRHAAEEHSTIPFTSIVGIHFHGVLEWLNLELHGRCGQDDGVHPLASQSCTLKSSTMLSEPAARTIPHLSWQLHCIFRYCTCVHLASRMSLQAALAGRSVKRWAVFAQLMYAALSPASPACSA